MNWTVMYDIKTRRRSSATATGEQREAFGVRGIPALSKAAEFAALQTLRDSGTRFADS